jgi:hypothetical protein
MRPAHKCIVQPILAVTDRTDNEPDESLPKGHLSHTHNIVTPTLFFNVFLGIPDMQKAHDLTCCFYREITRFSKSLK